MKTVKQYIKNPKFGQGDEPEFLPVGTTGIDAVKNRLLQVERQELNLTIKNSKNYSTLTEAIADVTDDKYKFRGFVLTFSNGSEWKSYIYNGQDSSGFLDEKNWEEYSLGGSSSGTDVEITEEEPAAESNAAVIYQIEDVPDEEAIEYITEAPADDNEYVRKNKGWVKSSGGSSSAEITKESIEKVFTGNIESHTHNSTYEYTEFETDVWDGSTISESLQGAGTKDDPYLIQSCADWIYFWNNSDTLVSTEGVDNPTGLLYFIKLVKSLDFNNLPVSYLKQSKTGLCDVDGCGATISNFIIDDKETGNGCEGNRYGIANTPGFCYFHDFNLVNITIKKTLNVTTSGNSSLGLGFFTVGESEALMGLHANNYIQGKIVLSGSISVNTTAAILEAGIGMYLFSYAPELVKNILKDKNMYFGSSITIEDNTVKTNGSKLTIQRTVVSDYNSLIGGTGSFIGYDNSISTLTGVTENEPVFEGDTDNFLIFMGRDYSNIFVCSEKSNGFLVMNESPVFIDSLRKTLEELNSDSFINTTLNSLELVFRKGTETPVLAPKNAKLKYDGYVRQSEFDELKKNPVFNEGVVYIPYDVFFNPEKTRDEASAILGGNDGLQNIIKEIESGKRLEFSNIDPVVGFTEIITSVFEFNNIKGLNLKTTVLTGFGMGDMSILVYYELNGKFAVYKSTTNLEPAKYKGE